LERGADPSIANASGNTPMHYAAQQEQSACLALLCSEEKIDVLTKNEFGRSILTEAIATGNGQIATIALEHGSATEERLIDGINKCSDDEEVIHKMFLFTNKDKNELPPLFIRELVITKKVDETFDSAAGDRTGLGVWSASLILARWLLSMKDNFMQNKKELTCIELGAGCGVPGLALAAAIPEIKVALTDFSEDALKNAKFNAEKNAQIYDWKGSIENNLQFENKLAVAQLDWFSHHQEIKQCDLIIGADLVYSPTLVPALTRTISTFTSDFFYVAPAHGRAGADHFLNVALPEAGFIFHHVEPAPAAFLSSPLTDNGDDDPFLLYFPDILTSSFLLHRFSKTKKTTVSSTTTGETVGEEDDGMKNSEKKNIIITEQQHHQDDASTVASGSL